MDEILNLKTGIMFDLQAHAFVNYWNTFTLLAFTQGKQNVLLEVHHLDYI